MKLLVFDAMGMFAHFRKFNSNSSSISYLFPPRTTIEGMIAGIMGYERDSYYDVFDKKKANISISLLTDNRKIKQTVNYLCVESKSDINGSNKKGWHTQIPLELVVSDDRPDLMVKYRVYVGLESRDLYEKLKTILQKEAYIYTPCLGAANCIADIGYIGEFEAIEKQSDDVTMIATPVNTDYIEKVILIPNLMKEVMPMDFNTNRVCQTSTYLFNTKGEDVKVVLRGNYYQIIINGEIKNLTFL